MKKLALSLIVLAASGAAFAQATASGVQGLVTATTGNQLTNVTSGMTIPAGSVVSATGNGSATLSMPGCTASLGPGQSMTITQQGCQSFVAGAGGAGAGAGAGGASGTFFTPTNNVLLGAAGVGLLAYNVDRNRKNNNGSGTPAVTPPQAPPVVVTPRPPRNPSRS